MLKILIPVLLFAKIAVGSDKKIDFHKEIENEIHRFVSRHYRNCYEYVTEKIIASYLAPLNEIIRESISKSILTRHYTTKNYIVIEKQLIDRYTMQCCKIIRRHEIEFPSPEENALFASREIQAEWLKRESRYAPLFPIYDEDIDFLKKIATAIDVAGKKAAEGLPSHSPAKNPLLTDVNETEAAWIIWERIAPIVLEMLNHRFNDNAKKLEKNVDFLP